jgi:hypothetical protein
VSPYVTFAFQTDEHTTEFSFRPEGLSLRRANPIGFRSSEYDSRDVLYLTLTDKDNHFDKSFIMFDADFKEGFKIMEDGLKLSTSDSEPRVWSLNESDATVYSLFLNCLPRIPSRSINIGFSTPSSGEYTFALQDLQNETIQTAVLLDKVTKVETDLLKNTYSFQTTGSVNTNDRFVLFINKLPVSIPEGNVLDIYAYTKDNLLTVKNIVQGDRVQVFDSSGRLLVSGLANSDEFTAILSQKGVYVVNVSGEKTSVLKVLNK